MTWLDNIVFYNVYMVFVYGHHHQLRQKSNQKSIKFSFFFFHLWLVLSFLMIISIIFSSVSLDQKKHFFPGVFVTILDLFRCNEMKKKMKIHFNIYPPTQSVSPFFPNKHTASLRLITWLLSLFQLFFFVLFFPK